MIKKTDKYPINNGKIARCFGGYFAPHSGNQADDAVRRFTYPFRKPVRSGFN
jgi:hypothetical protein